MTAARRSDGGAGSVRLSRAVQAIARASRDGRASVFRIAAILVSAGNSHVARWDDRGDRVLVDHLIDAVAQQHDELIERVDLSLQLDPVDQINRYRNLFST